MCDDQQDEFLKNEYIINLNELVMTRNYIYKEKTYQKYKITDLSVKKSNSYVRNIYEENGKILTHKHGYPQFYTQIVFEKGKQEIFMKTVLNDEIGISKFHLVKKLKNLKKKVRFFYFYYYIFDFFFQIYYYLLYCFYVLHKLAFVLVSMLFLKT
tara:strand:- start:74 stop:538 length:465 start_codon:yes stop_codon:yes gene_type:complete